MKPTLARGIRITTDPADQFDQHGSLMRFVFSVEVDGLVYHAWKQIFLASHQYTWGDMVGQLEIVTGRLFWSLDEVEGFLRARKGHDGRLWSAAGPQRRRLGLDDLGPPDIAGGGIGGRRPRFWLARRVAAFARLACRHKCICCNKLMSASNPPYAWAGGGAYDMTAHGRGEDSWSGPPRPFCNQECYGRFWGNVIRANEDRLERRKELECLATIKKRMVAALRRNDREALASLVEECERVATSLT